mgnify:CR=1 FL=1
MLRIDSVFERILAVGAHPDDIELGCFGTLARFGAAGSSLSLLVMTCGGVKGDIATRRSEAEASARLLGAVPAFGDLPDTAVPEGNPTIALIEAAIASFKPTVVITHSPNDTHQDHRNVSRAVVSAARFVPTVLFFQTPSSTRFFNPQMFVDITDHLTVKLAAVRLHESQGANVYMADRAVEGLAEFLGFQLYQGGKRYEGFEIHQAIV